MILALSTIVSESLDRLSICRCSSQLEFAVTLNSLLKSPVQPSTKLLIIDTLDNIRMENIYQQQINNIAATAANNGMF